MHGTDTDPDRRALDADLDPSKLCDPTRSRIWINNTENMNS
jgi:hypothetical protein